MRNTRNENTETKRSGRVPCHWDHLWGLTLSGDVQVANGSKFIDLDGFSYSEIEAGRFEKYRLLGLGFLERNGGAYGPSQPKVGNGKQTVWKTDKKRSATRGGNGKTTETVGNGNKNMLLICVCFCSNLKIHNFYMEKFKT